MKTALIIEDNDNNMELLVFILEAHGYGTLRATTGKEGMRRAVEDYPDFVLLDVQLPDVEGPDVVRAIRASEQGRSVPIIAVTSFAMSGDRERLISLGCNGYIEKPIDPVAVVTQIRSCLGIQD
jgi:two-component system, cell cycle response regulator DivK